MTAWINEFHYDNTSADVGEFIEVAGAAGTNLTGWSIAFYNGSPSQLNVYATLNLTGTIADQQNGFGTLSFAQSGIQNGNTGGTEPDGFALVNDLGVVVQFLSYEGLFTAGSGPAAGLTSTDIGIFQAGTEPAGSSLHLVGTGDEYADFTWAATTDDSPGARNAGQTFGSVAGVTVSINDVSITEGDAGTSLLTFTVTRSANTGAFSVDFATADATATAGSDYLATSGTLNFTAGGDLTQTISVTINGDTVAEPNEGFTVTLSNLVGAGTTIADDSGAGTITNDDITLTEIAAVQGAGHKSSFVGGAVGVSGNSGTTRVSVEGVVTAITTNGFWMQDPTPDSDDATSDGIFVFTSTAPAGTITVGETVRVLEARVDEFRPGGGGGGNNLTVTQLNASVSGASIVELGGTTAIDAVVIGPGGRLPPTGAIEDDAFATFDITGDAIDFYESLEGMLVQLPTPKAVSITAEFRTRLDDNTAGPPNEEIWVVVPGTEGADPASDGGAPLLRQTDANPERIQIDDLLPSIDLPDVDVGDTLSTVTGVMNYDFGNYEVLVSTAPTVTTQSTRTPEVTGITRDGRQLTVASYNVENLDPEVENTSAWGTGGVAADGVGGVTGSSSGNSNGTLYNRLGNSDDDVGSGKYAKHAAQIAINLGAPSIVALQEVQDSDGAEISSVVDATATLQTLIDLIFANHGIQYAFAFANPPGSNQDGGQPNANIRPAFLYRADQVTLLDNTPEPETVVRRLTDPNPDETDGFAGDDFASSRKPLEARFDFNGQVVTVINNHWNSKGGDNGLFGNTQPPVLNSELQRIEQAKIVNARVDDLLAADPTANILVVGDLNDFAWSAPNRTLDGTFGGGTRVLTDLTELLLPATDRYGYNFQGNAQSLDHMLASDALLDAAPAKDIVHVNSEFMDGASDHDPSLARFDFREFAERLSGGAGRDTIDGMGGADSLDGGLGNDSLLGGAGDDVLTGGEGRDGMRGGAGNDLYNVGPGDMVIEVAGEGADTVVGTGTIRLGAEIEAARLEGMAVAAVFGNGLDNILLGNDAINALNGDAGDDSLSGGGGNDALRGGDDADTLAGGAGRDVLDGGAGADIITLGDGGFERDVVIGFETGIDHLLILADTLDPLLAEGALDPALFEANLRGQASSTAVRFVYETDSFRLWWDTDGAGAGRTLLGQVINPIGGPLTAGDVLIG